MKREEQQGEQVSGAGPLGRRRQGRKGGAAGGSSREEKKRANLTLLI